MDRRHLDAKIALLLPCGHQEQGRLAPVGLGDGVTIAQRHRRAARKRLAKRGDERGKGKRRADLFGRDHPRSEANTSELQSLMRISYAVFSLKKKYLHMIKKFIVHNIVNQITASTL